MHTCWPTKLALAPVLAARLARTQSDREPATPSPPPPTGPAPRVAAPPWETCEWHSRSTAASRRLRGPLRGPLTGDSDPARVRHRPPTPDSPFRPQHDLPPARPHRAVRLARLVRGVQDRPQPRDQIPDPLPAADRRGGGGVIERRARRGRDVDRHRPGVRPQRSPRRPVSVASAGRVYAVHESRGTLGARPRRRAGQPVRLFPHGDPRSRSSAACGRCGRTRSTCC